MHGSVPDIVITRGHIMSTFVVLLFLLAISSLESASEGCLIAVCHIGCNSYSCRDSVGFSDEPTGGFLSDFGLNVSVSSIPYSNATNKDWFVLVPCTSANLSDTVNTARSLGYSFLLAYPPSGEDLSLNNEAKNLLFPIVIVDESSAISIENVTLAWSVANVSLLSQKSIVELVAVTSGVVFGFEFVTIICCCILCYCRARRVNRYAVEEYTPINNRAQQELIDSIRNHLAELQATVAEQSPLGASETQQLPTRKFELEKEAVTCGICIDDFKSGDVTRVLPCGHYFHIKCIDEWLGNYACVCPMCKKVVPRQTPHI